MEIIFREASLEDLTQITSLFRDTVNHINSKDYSTEQIQHWKSGADDLQKWEQRIRDCYFALAESGNTLIGFAYLKSGNYFDGLFVHHEHQSRGIATLLADNIESKARDNGYDTVHSDVSITAKPFFEKRGYELDRVQKKPYHGMVFTNYLVSKVL